MVIEKDMMVSLKYVLREGDSKGSIVEEVKSDNPLQFLYGAGQMLPRFESNIEKLAEGDKFEFKHMEIRGRSWLLICQCQYLKLKEKLMKTC